MAYESAPISRFKARYNSDNDDNDLVFQCVRKGVKLTPTSATITIYKPGTATAVLAATAMTYSSGTLLTYQIDTTTVADFPVATGYRAHIITTVGSVTEDDDFYFDVVENVPQGKITRDQLLKLDERVQAMDHAGDDDLSELIQVCWEENQLDLETRYVDGGYLLDNMVVDRSRLSVVVRFLCLARLLRPKGHSEDADYYEGQYKAKMRQILSGGMRLDTNEDMEEDSSTGPAVIRLVN